MSNWRVIYKNNSLIYLSGDGDKDLVQLVVHISDSTGSQEFLGLTAGRLRSAIVLDSVQQLVEAQLFRQGFERLLDVQDAVDGGASLERDEKRPVGIGVNAFQFQSNGLRVNARRLPHILIYYQIISMKLEETRTGNFETYIDNFDDESKSSFNIRPGQLIPKSFDLN